MADQPESPENLERLLRSRFLEKQKQMEEARAVANQKVKQSYKLKGPSVAVTWKPIDSAAEVKHTVISVDFVTKKRKDT